MEDSTDEFFRRLFFAPSFKMTILKSQTNKISYDEAVTALNSLQTNAITLKKTRKERQRNVHLNLPITRKNFERSGMTLEDLNKMKIIHVSGTKGKGSTCAFCESILRHSGLKTGFYSSPHLVSVTERIRINGKPIEQVHNYFYLLCQEIRLVSKNDSSVISYFPPLVSISCDPRNVNSLIFPTIELILNIYYVL